MVPKMCACVCSTVMVLLLLHACMQVHMLLQQSDFEAGKVQLEFQAAASPLGANRALLESNLSGEVVLTQRRSMEVTVALDQATVSAAGGQLLSCCMNTACLSPSALGCSGIFALAVLMQSKAC